ncbi:MAG: hypothetical protein KDB68_11905, partial [Planctomycetes bacterium]|nr:hypothetical protein [Planctomycetota bacterium]
MLLHGRTRSSVSLRQFVASSRSLHRCVPQVAGYVATVCTLSGSLLFEDPEMSNAKYRKAAGGPET